MNVTEALAARCTIRAFRSDPVPRGTLLAILEAALRSPSWANTQPWEVFVAGGESLDRIRGATLARTAEGVPGAPDLPAPREWPAALQQRTADMTAARAKAMGGGPGDDSTRRAFLENNRRFFGAPVVVYLCLDRSLTPWSVFDTGMFAQSVMLAAQEHGVDSAPAVNLVIYPDLVRAELGIPDDLMILMGVALGYRDPDDLRNAYRTSRRALGEVVRLEGV